MNRHLIKLPVIFFVAAMAAMTAWTQPGATGTVKGTVSGVTGPVAGSRVVVGSRAVSSYTAATSSASNGTFTVTGAPLGTVDLKAYDPKGNVIATGTGNLTSAGQVITVALSVH
jgi:hypothetical protein